MQAKEKRYNEPKQEGSKTCSLHSNQQGHEEQAILSDRSVVNRLTLMVGKRATELFGPVDVDQLVLEDGKSESFSLISTHSRASAISPTVKSRFKAEECAEATDSKT